MKPQDRRNFIKTAGAATALTTVTAPYVFGQEKKDANVIKVALIGCGGRGTGAASQALSVKNAQTRLVAMADVFPHRLESSLGALKNKMEKYPDRIDVPEDRQYIGFDAYKDAMLSLIHI